MTTIMISLVSEQAMPNIIACLQWSPRPDRVICLVSADLVLPASKNYAREFDRAYDGIHDVLTGLGIEVRKTAPVHPYNVDRIMSVCRNVCDQCDRGDTVVFNITGGTKLMALGAALVAQQGGHPIVYVDSERGCLIELRQGEAREHPFKEERLAEITVTRYLEAYGVSLTEPPHEIDPVAGAKVAEAILKHPQGLDLVKVLREKISSSPSRIVMESVPGDWWNLLRCFDAANLFVKCADEGGGVEITLHKAGREYFTGRWLEYCVYGQVKRLPAFRDPRFRARVNWAGRARDIDNEVDVLSIRGARLLLVECKSGGMPVTGDDVLKLQMIGAKCGTYTDKLLVTTADPPRVNPRLAQVVKNALLAGIAIAWKDELRDLGIILLDVPGHLEMQRMTMGI